MCTHPQGGDSAPTSRNVGAAAGSKSGASSMLSLLLPLLLIIAAVAVNFYLSSQK
jgi:hypothetical protein